MNIDLLNNERGVKKPKVGPDYCRGYVELMRGLERDQLFKDQAPPDLFDYPRDAKF